jgi:hypothetical protein
MTPREREEYRALRATIRERGTTRAWLFLLGLTSWAGLVIATLALTATPFGAALTLLVLAATFEAIYGVHVGVERLGRYLQVYYDDSWELTAMAFGAPLAGTGADPLFVPLFALATALNLVPLLVAGPVPLELAVVGGAHAIFLARVMFARHAAGRQRSSDLERFRRLKKTVSEGRSPDEALPLSEGNR